MLIKSHIDVFKRSFPFNFGNDDIPCSFWASVKDIYARFCTNLAILLCQKTAYTPIRPRSGTRLVKKLHYVANTCEGGAITSKMLFLSADWIPVISKLVFLWSMKHLLSVKAALIHKHNYRFEKVGGRICDGSTYMPSGSISRGLTSLVLCVMSLDCIVS